MTQEMEEDDDVPTLVDRKVDYEIDEWQLIVALLDEGDDFYDDCPTQPMLRPPCTVIESDRPVPKEQFGTACA